MQVRDWRLAAVLFAGALLLVGLYGATQAWLPENGWPTRAALRRMFDLNEEANAPAWYASALWLLAAGLAVETGRGSGRRLWWWSLAALFAFFSLDEAAQVHELAGILIEQKGSARQGVFFYEWVIYGLALAGVLTLAYGRFVLSLPRLVKLLLMAAAAVFLAGAVGLEMLTGAVMSGIVGFPVGLGWKREVAAEELLEMSGVILLIQALLTARRLAA